jgi:hypothetical protein
MAYVTNRLEALARFLRVAVAHRTVETARPAKVEGSTAEELSLGRRHAAILTFAEHHELYVWSHNERHTFVNDFWETRQCNAMQCNAMQCVLLRIHFAFRDGASTIRP